MLALRCLSFIHAIKKAIPMVNAVAQSPVARSLAGALIDDPFYRTVTVACGDDGAARLEMLAVYFELALAEGNQGGGSIWPILTAMARLSGTPIRRLPRARPLIRSARPPCVRCWGHGGGPISRP